MLIAAEKYQSNLVEYILYMFHIEDVIRAHNFDITELENKVISKYNLPESKIAEVRKWYKKLVSEMEREDIKEIGHLSSLVELGHKLNDLHIQLLNTLEEDRYKELYHWASPHIKELKSKMNKPSLTEVEVCLNGLYALMLMKMKGREVSDQTSEAMSLFGQLLKYLSKKHFEIEQAAN